MPVYGADYLATVYYKTQAHAGTHVRLRMKHQTEMPRLFREICQHDIITTEKKTQSSLEYQLPAYP